MPAIPRWLLRIGAASCLALAGVAGAAVVHATWPRLEVSAPADGAVLGRARLESATVTVRAASEGQLAGIVIWLDGHRAHARRDGDRLVLGLAGLAEGEHELAVTAPGSLLASGAEATRTFTVDVTAPVIDVPERLEASSLRDPTPLKGTAKGAVTLTANGKPVPLEGGAFSVRVTTGTVRLVATDAGGNRAEARVPVAARHPGMRAVHMTALAWKAPHLREPILKLAREGRIDTIELDIKDESGLVGYQSRVPLARKIGAVAGHYDARKVIEQLHGMGVRVVGRLVCFRDPVLARAAWRAGQRERVVQTPAGRPYGDGDYGDLAFTNFANPEVRAYNIALAVEAAKLGFDDVLYDYVRRPDGDVTGMRFPGLNGSPGRSIARFLADSRKAIHPHGAFLGASVFGIAASHPTAVAQDIPLIAQEVDYVAPMVYPSHWGPGEYGVASPNEQPYEIVRRSLADFAAKTKGTRAQVIPWLQDFSLGVDYGPAEVKAQIKAAADTGMPSFLLWNARARYHAAALSEQS